MKRTPMMRALRVVLWLVVAAQTFDVVRGHFPSKQVFTWLMFVLLATAMTLPIHRWPLRVRVAIGLLLVSAAAYDVYLAGLDLSMLWLLLAIALPVGAWLVLRRWAPWQWAKSQWLLFGLVMGGTAIGLWLAVALKA